MNIKDFSIPESAGCYLFKDGKDQIIYVGKSKFLPKRVSSYFQKNHQDSKTIKLVTEIKNVEFISTDTENEALVLEEDLIKLYKPKFNIKGKDDRTIRSKIVLTGSDWKRLELFFPQQEFDGEVIGEFTSGRVAHEVYGLIYDLFQLHTCSYNLTKENIENGKFKTCLDYQIGKCSAPCVGLASRVEHLISIRLIKDIFSQNFKSSISHFKKKMKRLSQNLEFEKAQSMKEKIEIIKRIEVLLKPLKVIEKRNRISEIQKRLELKFLPNVIDAFDNSHTGGSDAVAGLVRFTLLEPDKSQWRTFNIKSGSGGDDYRSFTEVLTRRFSRLINERKNLPNLVIIDGARPQLNVAISVFDKLKILDRVDLISISKNEKHQPNIIHLTNGKDISIKEFKELAHILNEVHRFSLNFHQKRRVKTLLSR